MFANANQHEQIKQVNAYHTANAQLQQEGFKVEAILGMMNNCADRCELRYFSSGIRNEEPQTECFKNCVSKAYKLSKGRAE